MEATMEKNLKLDYTLTKRTVEVAVQRLSGFEKLIKNIKRFSKHLKLPEPVVKDMGTKKYYAIKRFTVGSIGIDEEYVLDYATITDDYNKVKVEVRDNDIIIEDEVNIFELETVEEIIPDNEWIILGVIDHTEGIVKAAPNRVVPISLIPIDLEGSCGCDHCNTNRRRNKTIYVQNSTNNEIKRVGGSCIKYYLGYDYEKVLGFITELNNLFNTFDYGYDNWTDEDGYFGGEYIDYTDLVIGVADVVKYFFWTVNNKGYTSKAAAAAYNEKVSQSDNGGALKNSTSEEIIEHIDFLYAPIREDKYYEENFQEKKEANTEFIRICKSYTNENYEVIQNFIGERVEENTFLVNSRNFFENGAVKIKHLRFILGACSMYYGMKMAEERKNAVNKEEQSSEHIGTVGEKMNLYNLTIVNVSGFEGGFGWTDVYKLKDENGNVFTKFGKLNTKFITPESEVKDLTKGAILSFCTDIKKHDEYRGVKQTTIGRLSKLK